jgi:predicted permease
VNLRILKVHGAARLEALLRDVAYALRQMRRAPGVALLAIVCLGLGIGVNTAIFGVVNGVLLRPMAVVDPERLVLITRGQGEAFSYADYVAFRDDSRSLAGVAATMPMESDLHVDGDADLAVAEVVSGNYGHVVGVPLTLGRWFTKDDEPSAVISDAVWERKFQRAADVLGRTIGSESQFYTIVGVARPAFGGTFAPMRTDLWVPVRTRPRLWARLEEPTPFNMLMVFGRLDDAAESAQAAAELTTIDAQITRAGSSGQRLSPIVADVVHGQPNRTGQSFARLLTSLLGAVVGVVLLIACANVGHLLLARGSLRRREFAMRRALGASRARLVQQLLVEAVLLALGGAAIGIVLATWTSRLLQATLPASIAVFALHVDVSLDWRALVFTSVIAVVAAVASGLWPALRASDVRPDEAFKGHILGGSVRRRPAGVIAQVAMSMVLLFVAASFLNGLDQLQRTAPGFEVAGRLYAHTALPSSSGSREARHSFYMRALERLRTIPGVERAALTSILPLLPSGGDCLSTASGMRLDATASDVSPDYFGTLGIPLVSGQDFSPGSLTSEPAAVIVNESLVRLAWPNESPIGKSIDLGCDGTQRVVVLGVVGDTAVRRIGERPSPHVYRQIMREAGGSFTTIVLAVNGDPATLTRPVREALIGLGQGVRVYEVQPLAVPVEQSYAAARWLTRVLAVFGLVALALAVVGLFGHTAHRVSRRTQEIGVRMALGARRGDVFREVLRDGMGPVLVGIGIGELVSLGLTGLVASVIDGATPAGLSNHLLVGAIWIAVAAFACCVPAARASGVDPLVALRHE